MKVVSIIGIALLILAFIVAWCGIGLLAYAFLVEDGNVLFPGLGVVTRLSVIGVGLIILQAVLGLVGATLRSLGKTN